MNDALNIRIYSYMGSNVVHYLFRTSLLGYYRNFDFWESVEFPTTTSRYTQGMVVVYFEQWCCLSVGIIIQIVRLIWSFIRI